MPADPIDLKLRVILVTTRAALRHAGTDEHERRAIVERGRALVNGLDEANDENARSAVARAIAELDEMERA